MTGCAAHGELLGGYVLDALSPDEMDAMRRHLDACPACAQEHAPLAGLPALLDRIEPADVPPPTPPAALEEVVLDRWARERRRERRWASERGRGGLRIGAGIGRAANREPRRVGPLRLGHAAAGAVACVVAAVVALALLLGGGDEPYARATLAGAVDAYGRVTVEQVPTGTRVHLEAQRLPGDVYEVWCVRTDGRWVSSGSFRADASGDADVTLTAAVEPGDYHTVVVTRGALDARHGPAVLRGTLEY